MCVVLPFRFTFSLYCFVLLFGFASSCVVLCMFHTNFGAGAHAGVQADVRTGVPAGTQARMRATNQGPAGGPADARTDTRAEGFAHGWASLRGRTGATCTNTIKTKYGEGPATT